MLIRVKSVDAKAVISNLKSYDVETKARLNKAVNRSLNAIRRGAKSRINNVTGNLSRGIKKTFDSQITSGTVRSKAFHAHLVEFGTRPIGSSGSKAKPLSTNPVTSRRGRWGKKAPMNIPGIGYRQSYRHRGMNKRPYLRPSFEAERSRYITNIKKAVQYKGGV